MLQSFRGVRLSSSSAAAAAASTTAKNDKNKNNKIGTFEVSSASSASSSTATTATKSSSKSANFKTPTKRRKKQNKHANSKGHHSSAFPSAADLGLKSVVVQRKLNGHTNYSLREVRKKITASNEVVVALEEGTTDKLKKHRHQNVAVVSDDDNDDNDDDQNEEDEDEQPHNDDNNGNGGDDSGNSPNWASAKKWDDLGGGRQQIGTKRGPASAQARLMLTTKSRKVRYGWYDKGASGEFKVAKEGDVDFKLTDPDERICFNERKAWAGDFVMCVGQTNLCKWL